MFENTNQEMVTEIARETMKVHRLRNIMAVIAIALTALLITVVCGAGAGTIRAILVEAQMNPGPGTNGAGVTGDLSVLEKVRQQPEVEWADIARPCMNGTPHNQEFAGNEVRFLGVNEGYFGHHYVDLLTGEYPKNAREILVSDTMAEKLDMDTEPGQKLTMNLMIIKNGESVETPMEFTISGFYDNPLRAITDYEEIYTTEDFQDLYNPELSDINSKIFVKFSGKGIQTSDGKLRESLERLKEETGAASSFYIMSQNYTTAVLGGAAMLLLMIACGYFLIYNIFYISVMNDIRFMGSMKTIGMTGKQIKSMLSYQVRRLGLLGMVMGIGAGTGLNLLVVRLLRGMDFSFARFYEVHPSLEIAVVAAAVFSMITVFISSRKALTLAARVSPVEAAGFSQSGKKKTIFAILSFTLSGILFCVLFTAFTGYDTEYMVKRMTEEDINVYQYHANQMMEASYEPMSQETVGKLEALPFVKESYVYYKSRNLWEKADKWGNYPESTGQLRYAGDIKDLLEKEGLGVDEGPYLLDEDGNLRLGIMGIPAGLLKLEKEHLNIYSGSIDPEKFATGHYLIYQPMDAWGEGEDYAYSHLKAGDKLKLEIYDFQQEKYVEKTYEIMAVVGGKPDDYAGMIDSVTRFVLPDTQFMDIYGESSEQLIAGVLLDTKDGDAGEQKKQLETVEKLVEESFNPQVHVRSEYGIRISEQTQKNQKVLIGIFVGMVFGFIGLMNMINTLVTGVLSRKIEFASMQSIGMTKAQMGRTICRDGLKMVFISAVFMIPAGACVASAVSVYPLSTGFVPGLYGISCALVILAGILTSAGTAAVLTHVLNQKTVVERLREAD